MAPQPTRLTPIGDHRDFDADRPELPAEGPTFRLGGEDFHCVPAPAGGTLARLYAAARVDDRGRQIFDAPNLTLFIEDVLAEELPTKVTIEGEGDEVATEVVEMQPCDDVERWRALMVDKKRPVEISLLGDVVVWLSGWYTDRPTQPSGR